MTALILTTPAILTSVSGLRRHYADDLVTAGTLLMWEPGNPADPFSGVPTAPVLNSGRSAVSIMPNLAEDVADLVGDVSDFIVTGSISGNILTVGTAHASRKIHIGDAVTGAGVPAGLIVAGYGTGTGGTGTYSLTGTATVGSQSMTIQTTTDALFYRDDGATTAANLDMMIERSAKGGLHVITSQVNMASFRSAKIILPGPIREYLFANPTHDVAWSALYRVTRADLTNTGPYAAIKTSSGANNGWINIGRGGPQGITGVTSVVSDGARNTVGMVHERVANAFDGTAAATAASLYVNPFGFGTLDLAYGDHGRNKSISAVLYRIVIEDLNVSGRSLAQFGAVDDAIRAALFASGGRYHGDTFTDPATFA